MDEGQQFINVDASEALAYLQNIRTRSLPRVLREFLKGASLEMEHVMQPLINVAPTRGGRLRSSMRNMELKEAGGMGRWVGTTAAHGIFIEHGTRPHPIPKSGRMPKGKFLAWRQKKGSRKFFFAKGVQHPGTMANPYAEITAENIQPKLPALFMNQAVMFLEGGM